MRLEAYNVFEFQTCQQALLEYLSVRQKSDCGFSVRSWSRQMEFSSHTLLQFWLKGKRKVKLHHLDKLSQTMGLNASEKNHLEKLVLIDNAKTPMEKDRLLKNMAIENEFCDDNVWWIEEFKVMSHWIHMALLSLRQFTVKEAYKNFEHLVPRPEIDTAIYRLKNIGLLEETEPDVFVARSRNVSTRHDVADSGAREYFKATADLAKQAVEAQSVEEREFQGLTLRVNPQNIDVAKNMIRKFRREFNSRVGGGDDSVYQMNIQFFRLSREPMSVSSSEGRDGFSQIEKGENS